MGMMWMGFDAWGCRGEAQGRAALVDLSMVPLLSAFSAVTVAGALWLLASQVVLGVATGHRRHIWSGAMALTVASYAALSAIFYFFPTQQPKWMWRLFFASQALPVWLVHGYAMAMANQRWSRRRKLLWGVPLACALFAFLFTDWLLLDGVAPVWPTAQPHPLLAPVLSAAQPIYVVTVMSTAIASVVVLWKHKPTGFYPIIAAIFAWQIAGLHDAGGAAGFYTMVTLWLDFGYLAFVAGSFLVDAIVAAESARQAARATLFAERQHQAESRARQLESVNRRLGEVDRMKTEFVSTVSHELRTPLTAIRGTLGLIRGGAISPVSDAGKNLLNVADDNATRLMQLINNLLDMDVLAAGRLSMELEALSAHAALSTVRDQSDGLAKSRNVRIDVDGDTGLWAHADGDRLNQVLTNLVTNALTYSPDGGTVRLTCGMHDGDFVRLAIADDGCGIPEEFQAEMYEMFTQADSSDTRAKGGTGLGLAVSKALVERMNGKLSFITAENEGTTFFIDLPYAADASAAAAADAAA